MDLREFQDSQELHGEALSNNITRTTATTTPINQVQSFTVPHGDRSKLKSRLSAFNSDSLLLNISKGLIKHVCSSQNEGR